jgi:uracil-DNA glycosylase family protein
VDPLAEVAREAAGCRACDLWKNATQTVFGEWSGTIDGEQRDGGPASGDGVVMLVGEQPGDFEDREGHPFVGPAGRVLDEAVDGSGLDRSSIYVTNAVKHFKWQPRAKRRIHDKPSRQEVLACRPWLEREIELVDPAVIVTLGATAAQSLLGTSFKLTPNRGMVLRDTGFAPVLVPTIHPSAILRVPDAAAKKAARANLVTDLRTAAKELAAAGT